MTSPLPPESAPLSTVLAEALGDRDLTVGELADRVAERGFGLIMVVLALPTLIPVLPPGSAATVGLLYIILAAQMLAGLPRPWLPARVRRYRLSAAAVRALRERGLPLLRRVERYSRPRLAGLDQRVVMRVVALAVLLLGVILLSPLPFLNTLPALTVLVLGVGLLNRDAVVLGAGLALTASVVAAAAAGAGALVALVQALAEWLARVRERVR
ncbi:MAG: exopolysaccharide biosynthesis protein [Armatimonadota bacterium]|nr:exopolysaccharide biosynthesis protein [Armatimonadota bacterium]MDR7402899.1 exopolysaccharide biosynthesis protein [Armatimonadota bacterium]MDR7404793.1 exopolysaccharide biosynthesis protein [Armatimonadota bacterium]MDR7436134.1 exopolysaccharide biosynthesis protein [Armatimonadota bacterium]MDR7472013.1 exopolysaccharide biosynthesis protein [Armatimonadota bacterium]